MADKYTLNVAQAADEMGTGTDTVLSLIESGVLPAAKLGKGFIIRKSDVIKHIDLMIANQTHIRAEKHKLKNPSKQAKPEEVLTIPRRGRARNPIPVLP